MITEIDRLASRRIAEGHWEEIRERIQQLMLAGLKHTKELKNTAVQMLLDEYGIDLAYAKILVDFLTNEVEKKRKKLQQHNREGSRGHLVGTGRYMGQQRQVQGNGAVLDGRDATRHRVAGDGSVSDAELYHWAENLLGAGISKEHAVKEIVQRYKEMLQRYTIPLEKAQQVVEKAERGLELGRNLGASRRTAADLRDDVAQAAKKYLEEAKAQGLGDDESSILDKLQKSWPYIVVSYLARILKDVMTGRILDENRDWSVNGATMNRFAASQALDRISDHLEALRQVMPREASNLRGLALRLDRVANTLEAEQETTERVSRIENELDDLGVDFTVAPNSAGKQATCIYAYKGQLNSSDEASVLGRIAKKHRSFFENMRDNRAYKITVPHHV